MALLEVTNVKKIYSTRFGGNKVQALSNVTFSVEEGEYVAIMGESGSGKTTLLNILATLDKPTAGEVLLSGVDMGSIPEKQLAMYRRNNLGFVFQDFNLLDTFSLKDNIMLPLVLSGKTYSEMAPKMMELSRRLSIGSVRRSETACSDRKSTDHRTEDHPGGRTDRGTGFQSGGRCDGSV